MKDEDGFGANYYGLDNCHECGAEPFKYWCRETWSVQRHGRPTSPELVSVVVFCELCTNNKGIWPLHFDNWFDEVNEITREEALLIHIIEE